MALDRPMQLLKLISNTRDPMRFVDLARVSGLPKSTLHRSLAELVRHRLLRLDKSTRTYRLGYQFFELAYSTWEHSDIRRVAQPHLRVLQDQAHETVHLAVRDGARVIYIDKLASQDSMQIFSAIGKRAPLHCTGVGKAILGALPLEDQSMLLSNFANLYFKRYTDNTLTTVEALQASMRDVAIHGYALDMEEHEYGIRCIAGPILDFKNQPIGSVSVTGPAMRMGLHRLRKLAGPVLQATRSISWELGCVRYPFGALQRATKRSAAS